AIEIAEPAKWLYWPEPCAGITGRESCVHWLLERLPLAEAAAHAAMHREAERLAAASSRIYDRETRQSDACRRCRAEETWGKFVPRTVDLFGEAASGPDWQQNAAPLDRLAGFAADFDRPAASRREAASVVAQYQQRNESLATHGRLSPPALSP